MQSIASNSLALHETKQSGNRELPSLPPPDNQYKRKYPLPQLYAQEVPLFSAPYVYP